MTILSYFSGLKTISLEENHFITFNFAKLQLKMVPLKYYSEVKGHQVIYSSSTSHYWLVNTISYRKLYFEFDNRKNI